MNAAEVIEFPRVEAKMKITLCIETIATAPRDRAIQLVDVDCGSVPQWGPAIWVDEENAWFVGGRAEYHEALRELEAGDITPDEFASLFWEQPTHWAETLPIPMH